MTDTDKAELLGRLDEMQDRLDEIEQRYDELADLVRVLSISRIMALAAFGVGVLAARKGLDGTFYGAIVFLIGSAWLWIGSRRHRGIALRRRCKR